MAWCDASVIELPRYPSICGYPFPAASHMPCDITDTEQFGISESQVISKQLRVAYSAV